MAGHNVTKDQIDRVGEMWRVLEDIDHSFQEFLKKKSAEKSALIGDLVKKIDNLLTGVSSLDIERPPQHDQDQRAPYVIAESYVLYIEIHIEFQKYCPESFYEKSSDIKEKLDLAKIAILALEKKVQDSGGCFKVWQKMKDSRGLSEVHYVEQVKSQDIGNNNHLLQYLTRLVQQEDPESRLFKKSCSTLAKGIRQFYELSKTPTWSRIDPSPLLKKLWYFLKEERIFDKAMCDQTGPHKTLALRTLILITDIGEAFFWAGLSRNDRDKLLTYEGHLTESVTCALKLLKKFKLKVVFSEYDLPYFDECNLNRREYQVEKVKRRFESLNAFFALLGQDRLKLLFQQDPQQPTTPEKSPPKANPAPDHSKKQFKFFSPKKHDKPDSKTSLIIVDDVSDGKRGRSSEDGTTRIDRMFRAMESEPRYRLTQAALKTKQAEIAQTVTMYIKQGLTPQCALWCIFHQESFFPASFNDVERFLSSYALRFVAESYGFIMPEIPELLLNLKWSDITNFQELQRNPKVLASWKELIFKGAQQQLLTGHTEQFILDAASQISTDQASDSFHRYLVQQILERLRKIFETLIPMKTDAQGALVTDEGAIGGAIFPIVMKAIDSEMTVFKRVFPACAAVYFLGEMYLRLSRPRLNRFQSFMADKALYEVAMTYQLSPPPHLLDQPLGNIDPHTVTAKELLEALHARSFGMGEVMRLVPSP